MEERVNIIVAVPSEQGMEVMGNAEGTDVMVFSTQEEAFETLSRMIGMPAELLPMMGFQLFALSDEELDELRAELLG